MNSSLWRVVWNLEGTKGPLQSMEFTSEQNAMGWAGGLLKAGGKGIIVTELIVGRIIHLDSTYTSGLLFQK